MPHHARLSVTAEVAAAITSSLVIDEVLTNITVRTAKALEVSECDMYGYHCSAETATCLALWAREPASGDDEWVGRRITLAAQPAFAHVLREGRMMAAYIDDPSLPEAERERMEASAEFAWLLAPLVFKDEVIGCLRLIERSQRRVFSERECELVKTLATLAAVALENARLHARLEEEVATTELERQRLELILANTADGVVLVDGQGSITFTNPTLRRLFGATATPPTGWSKVTA